MIFYLQTKFDALQRFSNALKMASLLMIIATFIADEQMAYTGEEISGKRQTVRFSGELTTFFPPAICSFYESFNYNSSPFTSWGEQN